VDVRVLYDAFGCQATPAAFFDAMERAGAKVHAYHTLWEAARHLSLLKFFRTMNRRDHRKLLVVDDRVAYFGGMNIVHQGEAGADRARDLPASAGWRDVHVRLSGSQQREIAESFERSWRRAHGLRVGRRRTTRKDASTSLKELATRRSGEFIRFLESEPNPRRRRLAAAFRTLIGGAARNVLISMAYFIPTGRVLTAIRRAAARGVQIRVIVPAKSDVKLVAYATRHMYARLLKMGVEIFERQDRMLHSKVMVVDDIMVVVGSCNLDPRSLLFNLEFVAIIRSAAMAQIVTAICNHEIASSRPVTANAS
jgi:cardiolipin synthase